MGAAVLVESTVTNKLLGLPINYYFDKTDILEYTDIDFGVNLINNSLPEQIERVKLSYWRDQIEEKRKEIV